MNFLNLIWLIPLFPLFGAALMLLVGKRLEPQPVSDVAIAPGVQPGSAVHDHAHPPSPYKFLISLIAIRNLAK